MINQIKTLVRLFQDTEKIGFFFKFSNRWNRMIDNDSVLSGELYYTISM